MNRIMRFFVILMGLMLACTAMGEEALSVDEQMIYEEVQICIDQGDCCAVAEMLLDGTVSAELYAYMLQENAQIMERVILDAMIEYGKTDNVKGVAALRMGGYVTDDSLADYWEAVGSMLPENMPLAEESSEVDEYLIYEMGQAFKRNSYVVRAFNEMRTEGVFNDAMHAALVELLGFDYTDEQDMAENGIAPLRVLTEEEKAIYDNVMLLIDEGDCNVITQMVYVGEINESIYRCLMQQDGELMDFVLSQGLAQMAANGKLLGVVQMRARGMVSDRCLEFYWESIGGELYEADGEVAPGIDGHLLHELKRICLTVADGEAIAREAWQSGMISDPMHEALVQALGFDYTQE